MVSTKHIWALALAVAVGGCDALGDGADGSAFSFVVFGDLNTGGCPRNERFHRLVGLMRQSGALFYLHTGDIIDGYDNTSCFSGEPPGTTCVGPAQSGDMAAQFAPLMAGPRPKELRASFFPIMGNHDGNWDEQWYPDLCGRGICDFLAMDAGQIRQTYLDRGQVLTAEGFFPHPLQHGDPCSTVRETSGHPGDFFYAFAFRNSLFIALYLAEDDEGLLSCHTVAQGYDSCAAYCADPALRLDPQRNQSCYNAYQWDWLSHTLAQTMDRYAHIFVLGHAPLLSSGDYHGPTVGAPFYRQLLESHRVTAYFNGHNHAYERTHPVRGDAITDLGAGTVYITVGPAGGLTDTIHTDWFTAYSYENWTALGDSERMTTYLLVRVEADRVTAELRTLQGDTVDRFSL